MKNKILEIFILLGVASVSSSVFAGGGDTCPGTAGSAFDIESCAAFVLSASTAASSCTPGAEPYTACGIKYLTNMEDATTPIVRSGTATIGPSSLTSGTISLTGSSSYSQTVNGVTYSSTYSFPKRTASKTAVFFSSNQLDNGNATNGLVYLTRNESGGNLNSIVFNRTGNSGTVTINFWVVYFPTGVTVRHGTFSMISSSTVANTSSGVSWAAGTSGSFDTNKSFLFFTWSTSASTFNKTSMIRGKLTGSNAPTFTRDATTNTVNGSFQVISVDRSVAIHSSSPLTLAATVTSNSASVSPTAVSARSLVSASCSYSTAGNSDDKSITVDLSTDGTTITIARPGGTGELLCEWTVFQFPKLLVSRAPLAVSTDSSGTAVDIVRRNTITVANGGTSNSNVAAFPFRQSSIIIPITQFPWNETTGNSNLTNVLMKFDSYTNTTAFDAVLATRGGTANQSKVQYNLITFGPIGRVILGE